MTTPKRPQLTDGEKVVVTPLKRFLLDTPTDALLEFVDKFDVSWTVTRSKRGARERHYTMTITRHGMADFIASSHQHYRNAITDCVARFLVSYEGDYHALLRRNADNGME